MTLPYPIAASQVDAKSPVDEQLMESIKLDLDYLDTQLGLQGSFDYQFKVNGYLAGIPVLKRQALDGILVSKPSTLQECRCYLEEPGDGGTLSVDIRRVNKLDAQITALTRQFKANINSIARAGSSNSTQSITRATAQISTQSVSLWKSPINVQSIVALGNNIFRYNLASAPDSDWLIGDPVEASGCSNAANNGDFVIAGVNIDGGNNILIENVSGVAQSSAAGTLQLDAWSYNFINPVSSEFAAGENGLFSSHPDAGNNGQLPIYAINQAGNNIIVKNANGVASGVATGFADVNRWIFAFLSAALTPDYTVGEKALMQSHSSGGNNGNFVITGVNSGGNNVIVYNENGVVQGGVAGTVDTLRWVYFFSVDPSSDVVAGQTVIPRSTTSAANSGEFVIKQVNRSTSDNIVLYNESGVAQGGAAGEVIHKRMLVKFASDQSASITTDSKIRLYGTAETLTDYNFQVLEVNRGGGANFNAVVETSTGVEQVGAAGRVVAESKSVFDTVPSITIPPSNYGFAATHMQVSTNAVFNATRKIIPSGTLLQMDILGLPNGRAKNLVVQLL